MLSAAVSRVLRNVAAHGGEDVSLDKALDYLGLADSVLYSIEVGRSARSTGAWASAPPTPEA